MRGRHARRNRRGVTDVPLELIIIVIILLIVIPIMVSALATYLTSQQFLALQQQASSIANTVVETYDGGANTTLTLGVTVNQQGKILVGAALFQGSTLNPNATYVTFLIGGHSYLVQFDNGATLVYASNFSCQAGHPTSLPLTLPSGSYTLGFTKVELGSPLCGVPSTYAKTFVEVKILP
ncbi:MAG: hypothetical protein M1144_04865 [Candidatus Thermoplasmatota archaeon]|jgi:hypothetical protein|nr:hypothetical protein [Candidatus Thermoplasmatota archaeon]